MGNDVEEGEISDTASLEEISEEDFNIKQEEVVKVVKETKSIKVGGGEGAGARVWTMRDLYNKYPTICRGYGPGLHNLAWAQAVQNKPLNDIFVKEVEQDDAPKTSSPASSVASVNSSALAGKGDKKEVEKVMIDDSGDEMEKEEGELEEGEIEMDLESESNEKVSEQVKEKEVKLTNVDSIREALESVVHVADRDE